ncbi:hypothetical protein D3C84_1268640 [compost metagenome]
MAFQVSLLPASTLNRSGAASGTGAWARGGASGARSACPQPASASTTSIEGSVRMSAIAVDRA